MQHDHLPCRWADQVVLLEVLPVELGGQQHFTTKVCERLACRNLSQSPVQPPATFWEPYGVRTEDFGGD